MILNIGQKFRRAEISAKLEFLTDFVRIAKFDDCSKIVPKLKCGFFDFHTTSGQKQWQKSLSVPNFVFFGKSIAEWGHGWVVHRWFENTIFDILWF